MKQLMAGLALAFAVVAVGCGGSQRPTMAKGPTCADVAANAEKAVVAMGQRTGEDTRAMATAGRETMTERCPADGWSAEVIACAAAAPDADQVQACVEKLTPKQHQAMEDTFDAKMNATPAADRDTNGEPSRSAPGGGAAPPDDPCGGKE